MKALNKLIQDHQPTLPLKSTLDNLFKEGTKVNKIYESLKTGKLNELIPERFGSSNSLSDAKYSTPTKKNIVLSFEYSRPIVTEQKKDLNQNVVSGVTPDILTMHKIKVPKGYVPISINFRYHVHAEVKEATQIIFKVGKKAIHIKPALDAIKSTAPNTKHNTKSHTLYYGNLDINLKDISSDLDPVCMYLNEDHEIPFSIFIHESKQHTFQVLMGCERGKSKLIHWKSNKLDQLKSKYNFQREKYERKFSQQLNQNKHRVLELL